MRHASKDCIEFIKKYERYARDPYVCPSGYLTGGYGHVFLPGESVRSMSRDDALLVLSKDCYKSERAVTRHILVPLSNYQFDALVSFTFNAGGGALQRSTLRMKLNRGDYGCVPGELMKWIRGGGRILNGLVKRRRSEGLMFLGG